MTYRKALPADVPRFVGLPREGEAGGDSRMLAYLIGQHHPQHALPPRVMWIAEDGESPIGYIAGHLTKRLIAMASCNGSMSSRNIAAATSGRDYWACWRPGLSSTALVASASTSETTRRGRSIDVTAR